MLHQISNHPLGERTDLQNLEFGLHVPKNSVLMSVQTRMPVTLFCYTLKLQMLQQWNLQLQIQQLYKLTLTVVSGAGGQYVRAILFRAINILCRGIARFTLHDMMWANCMCIFHDAV